MTTKPIPAGSGCVICRLGDDRTRALIGIERDPTISKTRLIRDMHLTNSRPKQREIFNSLPFHFVNGQWQRKDEPQTIAAD